MNYPKASVLFDSWDLQIYKQWRRSVFNEDVLDDDDILLPSAFEYADFLEWRAGQGPQSPEKAEVEEHVSESTTENFVCAIRCGHPLHPGHPMVQAKQKKAQEENEENDEDPILWCSMCTLQTHLKLLAELWDHWLEMGGPWRNLPRGGTAESFQLAKRAYYKRRVDLINEMDVMEDFAHLEAVWKSSNPEEDIKVTEPWSATNTLVVYAKGIQFPGELVDEDEVVTSNLPPKTQKKRLSYTPDTPQDTRHRPSGLYARRYSDYDASSPHHCPNDDGWAETSFKNDWEYTIRQCRLLLCDRDPSLPDVTYRTLADDFSRDRLADVLNDSFSSMNEDWKQSWVNELLGTTDIFLVWKDQDHASGDDHEFDSWDKVPTLVGTRLEDFARQMGDLDEGETTSRLNPVPLNQPVEDEEQSRDYFDKSSLASERDEEQEVELADVEEPLENGAAVATVSSTKVSGCAE